MKMRGGTHEERNDSLYCMVSEMQIMTNLGPNTGEFQYNTNRYCPTLCSLRLLNKSTNQCSVEVNKIVDELTFGNFPVGLEWRMPLRQLPPTRYHHSHRQQDRSQSHAHSSQGAG